MVFVFLAIFLIAWLITKSFIISAVVGAVVYIIGAIIYVVADWSAWNKDS